MRCCLTQKVLWIGALLIVDCRLSTTVKHSEGSMKKRIKGIYKNKDTKALISNFVSLSIISGVNIIVPLIVLPYIIKTVGVSNYGKYAFIFSIVFYFLYVSQYGFSLSAVRDVAQARDNLNEVNKIFNRVMHTKFFVFTICTVALIFISFTFSLVKNDLFLLYTTYLIVLGDILNPTWLYQGMERMKFMTIVNVVSKLTYIILVFLFIKEATDYRYIGLLQASGFILAGTVSFYMAIRAFNLKLLRVSLSEVIQQLKDGFSSFVTLIMPMLYVNTSTFLLGVFGTTTHVAYFDSAYKISNGFVTINGILTNVFYPYVNRKANKFMIVSVLLIASGALMSILCFVLSKWIVTILFGAEMFDSIIVLKILSLTPLLLAIRSAFGVNYLLVKRKDKLYMSIAMWSSIIAFLSGLYLINRFQSTGAAIVVILAQGLYSITSMYFALKIIRREKSYSSITD